MTISKMDLQSLQKEIKELGRKMDKLITAAGKVEKPKVAKKTTAKPIKAKLTKKTTAKPVKAKPTKKAPAKKAPAKKGTTQPTATDQVLKIINRSKKGVNIKTLMEKTSFNQKKVTNILQRTFKQGKIKRAGKGVYVGGDKKFS